MSDCENFVHEWIDHYYGLECKNCKLTISMPNARAIESPALAKANLVIDDKGKRAKEIAAARALGPKLLKKGDR